MGTDRLSSIFMEVNSTIDSVTATTIDFHKGKFKVIMNNATAKKVIVPSILFIPTLFLPKTLPMIEAIESANVNTANDVKATTFSYTNKHSAEEKKKNVAEFIPSFSFSVNMNGNKVWIINRFNLFMTNLERSISKPNRAIILKTYNI